MPGEATYQDPANREDLLDLITNLDFNETQLFNGLGTAVATATTHEWMTDTLKTPGLNKEVEGADATYPNRTRPVRLNNVTQIVEIGYQVTDTERAVNTAGFNDRYTYEAEKAMKEFKQDCEFSLIRGTKAVGDASTAREMDGVKSWLNNTRDGGAAALTETLLNDDLQSVWEDGTEVNSIYAHMSIKRLISGFTAGNTKNVQADDKRLVNAVDVYVADSAPMVKLFAHRYVTVSGDTNYDIVGLNDDFFRIAWLRKPFTRELAKTGDATKGQVIGELTLECLHQDAGFLTTNTTLS